MLNGKYNYHNKLVTKQLYLFQMLAKQLLAQNSQILLHNQLPLRNIVFRKVDIQKKYIILPLNLPFESVKHYCQIIDKRYVYLFSERCIAPSNILSSSYLDGHTYAVSNKRSLNNTAGEGNYFKILICYFPNKCAVSGSSNFVTLLSR